MAVGSDYATIEWADPRHDGGANIKAFHIYAREDGTSGRWAKVSSVESFVNIFTAKRLSTERVYIFGVSAENDAGASNIAAIPHPVAPEKRICKHLFYYILTLF